MIKRFSSYISPRHNTEVWILSFVGIYLAFCLSRVKCFLKMFFFFFSSKRGTMKSIWLSCFQWLLGSGFSLCFLPWPEWAPCFTVTWSRIVPSFLHWHLCFPWFCPCVERTEGWGGSACFPGAQLRAMHQHTSVCKSTGSAVRKPSFWAASWRAPCVLLSPLGRINGKESLPV